MIDDPALARRIHDVDLTVSRLEGIGVCGRIARPIHNVAAIGVGFVLVGGHPDDVANEEYFGVVDADRNPKEIFFKLRKTLREIP